MKNTEIKLSKENLKVIAFILLYLIVSFLVIWYLAKPLYSKIGEVNAQISKQEEKLALLKTAQSKLTTINKDITDFSQRIETLKKLLPVEDDEFLYGEEFIILANTCQVKISSLAFPKSTQNQPQNTKSFRIAINANNLQNIGFFIDAVRNFPQITELNVLNVSKTQETKTTQQTTVTPPYSAQIEGIINLSQRK